MKRVMSDVVRVLPASAVSAIAPSAIALSANTVSAQAKPELTLTRLDCATGAPAGNVGQFSDTYEFEGVKIALTYNCYLIKHGNDYLIWDTGNAMGPAAT